MPKPLKLWPLLALMLTTGAIAETTLSKRQLFALDDRGVDAFNEGDYGRARLLWQKTAAAGSRGAQYNLGELFFTGLGVTPDYKRARHYYERAAAGRQSIYISYMYLLGQEGQAVPRIGFRYKRADAPARAQSRLGMLYYRGLGVPRDYEKARQYWERAAANGDDDARFSIGSLYHEGTHVARDYGKALALWESAALNGHGDAQFNLGILYYVGMGVPLDYRQARYWFKKAAAGGDTI